MFMDSDFLYVFSKNRTSTKYSSQKKNIGPSLLALQDFCTSKTRNSFCTHVISDLVTHVRHNSSHYNPTEGLLYPALTAQQPGS